MMKIGRIWMQAWIMRVVVVVVVITSKYSPYWFSGNINVVTVLG